MRKISKIEPTLPTVPKRKRVAAYARVSMETDRLMHSLSAQISYYNDLIQKNPEWEYAGVYADSFITGTNTKKRTEFQRLISDCEMGLIDIVLCKSISRFARNTVDLLETVRHLKELGIEVRFEKENINSLSGDGEFMLTILASFAQEEVRSISENVKWGTRKRFEQGIPNGKFRVFGYEWQDDRLVPVPEEAAVVKRIFQNFIDGKSRLETERELNAEGITTRAGCKWEDSNIKVILTNITYTGNLLLQKEYIEDPITKHRCKNRGELPQYFVEGTHEPIIDMETFQWVQDEMKRRKELGALANKSLNTCCFTGKIKCPYCGQSYMHNKRSDRGNLQEYWNCGATKKKGGRCPVGGSINHKNLIKKCTEVLELQDFDEDIFLEQVDFINIPKRQTLEFHFYDGRQITVECRNTGHKDCWTPEYRAKVSEQRKNSVVNRGDYTCFTKKIKCVQCGCNFRKSTSKIKTGKRIYWSCQKHNCDTIRFREDALKNIAADVLGIQEFDESVFVEKIVRIDVRSSDVLEFVFVDGHTVKREWVQPERETYKWTPERREKMRQKTKESWTPERRARMSEIAKEMRRREKCQK